MRRHSFIVLIALFAGVSLLAQARQVASLKNVFVPGELLQAAEDIPYPNNSVALGAVILEAAIDPSGKVEDVIPIRPIPSLTEPAIRSIKAWQFKPAILDGKPVASRVTVAVVFNPVYFPLETQLPPRVSAEESTHTGSPFQPAEVVSTYLSLVPNALSFGTVVLQAKINTNGEMNYASVVRDVPGFTSSTLEAIKKWQFKPAQYGGNPITSSVSVAFVVRVQQNNNP
jgi:TonB family protein